MIQYNHRQIKARFQEIESLMQNPANLANPQKLKNLTLEYNELKEKKELIDKLEKLEADFKQAEETLNSANEEEIKKSRKKARLCLTSVGLTANFNFSNANSFILNKKSCSIISNLETMSSWRQIFKWFRKK